MENGEKIGFNILLLTLSLPFVYHLVIEYLVNENWSIIIPSLRNNIMSRNLLIGHMITGILGMILFPLQRLIAGTKYIKIHRFLGIFLIIDGFAISLFGLSYIIYAGTIGGVFMSVAFWVYGFCLYISCIAVAYFAHERFKYYEIFDYDILVDHSLINDHHRLSTNIFGALIYSSLFYYILYNYAIKMNYSLPITEAMYERPLDRGFQTIFFVIPVILTLIWHYLPKYHQLFYVSKIIRCIVILTTIIVIIY